MNISPLIDIQDVSYAYPSQGKGKGEVQHILALRQVHLQIERGEYLVVLGHNGSGKSTLARHCNALLLPDQGRVLIGGIDTRDQTKRGSIRESIGMIFHNPDYQIIATVVEDDVAWSLTTHGFPASLIRECVTRAMTTAGIINLRDLPPHRLSGGQRQRVAIAGVLALHMALAAQGNTGDQRTDLSPCIIADEATALLDPLARREINCLLHQLNQEQGLTIIQVTHLLEEATEAQRIVAMEQGQVVMEGTPATIFSDLPRLRDLKLAIPEPIELAARLRAVGIPISPTALTTEAIAQEFIR